MLPAELWDGVLDHLHDDTKTLRACSLVCRSWCPSSQMHLFHTVQIDSSKTWNRFRRSVQLSPKLAHNLVKKVVIYAFIEENPCYDALDAPLASLEALHIQRCWPPHLRPNPFLKSFRNANDITFRDCAFDDFQTFCAILSLFPIRRLGIYNVGWWVRPTAAETDGADTMDLSPRSLSGDLTSIGLRGVLGWILRCTPPDSVNHIRHEAHHLHNLVPRQLLLDIGQSVQSLECVVQDIRTAGSVQIPPSFDAHLRSQTNLQSIRFSWPAALTPLLIWPTIALLSTVGSTSVRYLSITALPSIRAFDGYVLHGLWPLIVGLIRLPQYRSLIGLRLVLRDDDMSSEGEPRVLEALRHRIYALRHDLPRTAIILSWSRNSGGHEHEFLKLRPLKS